LRDVTLPVKAILRQRLVRVITRRAASSSAAAVAEAARRTHDDLMTALAPLISSSGVEALWARAFDLARREYPHYIRSDASSAEAPVVEMGRWLETQSPSIAIEASAAMFATFAELLGTMIGETLTTRYLEQAWPDGFSDVETKRKKP
jgi:hypothetical protein